MNASAKTKLYLFYKKQIIISGLKKFMWWASIITDMLRTRLQRACLKMKVQELKVDQIWHRLIIKKIFVVLKFFLKSYVIFLSVIQIIFGPIKLNYSLWINSHVV